MLSWLSQRFFIMRMKTLKLEFIDKPEDESVFLKEIEPFIGQSDIFLPFAIDDFLDKPLRGKLCIIFRKAARREI